jgi:hypothetical protein
LRRNGFPTLLRWDHRINTTQTVNGTTVLAFSGDASQMLAGQWYVGVWGAQAAGQEACPYSLTVSKNEAISLPLGVDNTFSAQGQFTHYYSFGLSGACPLTRSCVRELIANLQHDADVPPLLEIEVGADPASCPTLPKVGLSFMVYPTVNASNFGNWSTSAEGVQTLIVPSQYLAPVRRLQWRASPDCRALVRRPRIRPNRRATLTLTGHLLPGRLWPKHERQLLVCHPRKHHQYAPFPSSNALVKLSCAGWSV